VVTLGMSILVIQFFSFSRFYFEIVSVAVIALSVFLVLITRSKQGRPLPCDAKNQVDKEGTGYSH
jgi:hypothetical protein